MRPTHDLDTPDGATPLPGYPRAQAAIRDAMHAITDIVDVIDEGRDFDAADAGAAAEGFASATRDMLELAGIARTGDPARPLILTADAELLAAIKRWQAARGRTAEPRALRRPDCGGAVEDGGSGTRLTASPPSDNPELNALLEKTRGYVMSPEEAEAQRQSWVRGEMALDRKPEQS